jgi:hypothetical protein
MRPLRRRTLTFFSLPLPALFPAGGPRVRLLADRQQRPLRHLLHQDRQAAQGDGQQGPEHYRIQAGAAQGWRGQKRGERGLGEGEREGGGERAETLLSPFPPPQDFEYLPPSIVTSSENGTGKTPMLHMIASLRTAATEQGLGGVGPRSSA